MTGFTRVVADVDLSAIRQNITNIMKYVPENVKALAVVKANAYGHGDAAVARAVDDLVDHYAVATLPEAVNLRNNGITKPILILGYVFPEEYPDLIANDITAVCFDKETAVELSEEAKKQGKSALVHIKCDTGMRRIGFPPTQEAAQVVKEISVTEHLQIKGIFTHFAKADYADKTSANKQLEDFKSFVKMCRDLGVEFETVHAANSAAAMDMEYAALDMVRLGIAMYGLEPSDEILNKEIKLKQAISLKAKVVMVKDVEAGLGVSYGHTYVTKEKTRIATVSIGYGDGYPRRLSNKGEVLVCGKRAPIIGRVCMDQFMINVTDIPGVVRGSDVILTGADGDDFISVEDVCKIAEGGFNYEFVCDIGKRIPRRYFRDGKCVGWHDDYYGNW